MIRTFITGIGGFTGRYVAEMLGQRGHSVHGLIHSSDSQAPINATSHKADLSDRDELSRILAEVKPDHVIHLAAISFVAHGDVDQMYRTNVVGTRNLLEAVAGLERLPTSVLVASSANIYGNARGGTLDESVPPAPANDYGVSKVATELVAGLYTARLPLIITRPFNYTGVGQAPHFLIPKIVDHARRRVPILELGNLDVERDFSDVRTVADAYVRLISESKAIGGTFNVCSGQPVALRKVVDLVSRLSGHEFEIQVNPAFVRSDEVRSLSGSPAHLESIVGPLNRITLDDTLRWMLTA